MLPIPIADALYRASLKFDKDHAVANAASLQLMELLAHQQTRWVPEYSEIVEALRLFGAKECVFDSTGEGNSAGRVSNSCSTSSSSSSSNSNSSSNGKISLFLQAITVNVQRTLQ